MVRASGEPIQQQNAAAALVTAMPLLLVIGC